MPRSEVFRTMRHGSEINPDNRFERVRRVADLEQVQWDREYLEARQRRPIEYIDDDSRGLVHVYVSITTLDAELARELEPRTSTPAARLRAIAALAAAGVPVGVMVAPIIPGLNDSQIRSLFRLFRQRYRLDGQLPPYDCGQFHPPPSATGQLSLF